MKRFLLLLILATIISISNKVSAQSGQELVDICMNVSEDITYLKDFQIKLESGDPPPISRQSIVLSKNTIYRFSICNSKDFQGEAILSLYDNNRLILTTHQISTGEDFPNVDFKCSKTGVYHVFVQFKDGQEGLAVAILSYVSTF